MADLQWTLCDLLGNPVAAPEGMVGAWVQIDLNGRRTASLPVSFEDEASSHISALDTVVKTRFGGDLVLAGIITRPQWSGSARQITCPISDPSIHLMKAFYPFGAAYTTVGGVLSSAFSAQPDERIREMVDDSHVVSGLPGFPEDGIINLEVAGFGSIITQILQPGDNYWDLITEIGNRADGIDFELMPVDRTDGKLVQVVVHYPFQGRDLRDTVVFEYGWGAENASDFSCEEAGDLVINESDYYGDTSGDEFVWSTTLVSRSRNDASINRYGHFGKVESAQIVDAPSKAAYQVIGDTDVQVYGFPPKFFTVVPAQDDGSGWRHDSSGAWVKQDAHYGQPPRFAPVNGDYWIGDIVRAVARDKPGLNEDLVGRIVSGKYSQVEGAVTVELTCVPVDQGVRVAATPPTFATTIGKIQKRSLKR